MEQPVGDGIPRAPPPKFCIIHRLYSEVITHLTQPGKAVQTFANFSSNFHPTLLDVANFSTR